MMVTIICMTHLHITITGSQMANYAAQLEVIAMGNELHCIIPRKYVALYSGIRLW